MTQEEVRRNILHKVDNWKFWMGVAYFGLCCVILALWVLFGRTTREEASRSAQQRSTAVQAVSTCFTGVKNAPVVSGFVDAFTILVDNSIQANKALLQTSENAELDVIRKNSLRRLSKAKKSIGDVKNLVDNNTPTVNACVTLAKKTNVPYQRYLKELTK